MNMLKEDKAAQWQRKVRFHGALYVTVESGTIKDDRVMKPKCRGSVEVPIPGYAEAAQRPGLFKGSREAAERKQAVTEAFIEATPIRIDRESAVKRWNGIDYEKDIHQAWWLWRDKLFVADADLTAEDVIALVNEEANKKRLRLQKAHALQAMSEQLDERARRQPIPQDVKLLVWQRDQGRCTACGSQNDLEYDHVIPLAMGGSNTDRNLQLLCADCNRRKGATLG
jgi:hypothetical protein